MTSASTITTVRDPGTGGRRVRSWTTSSAESHHTDITHHSGPSYKSPRQGRFHHHHHLHHNRKNRRNTTPLCEQERRRPKVDTAFLSACKDGDLEMFKTVVSHGRLTPETLNQQDESGKTAMNYICSHGNLDLLKILTTISQVDVNLADVEGNTPLITASQAGHSEMVAVLLRQYKDAILLDQRNVLGFTPLMKAALQGRVKCVKVLLQAGASPWLTDYGRGFYALQWAKYCGRHCCADLIERFLKSSNQKAPPVIKKKQFKQKIKVGRSSSEPDIFNVMNNGDVNNSLSENEQTFNNCPVENSNVHDQNWLKRGLKKAFQRKPTETKVLQNITGVGMLAAASGGIISKTPMANKSKDNGTNSSKFVIPKVQVTDESDKK